MNVERSQPRRVEQARRKDLPVRRHHHRVGTDLADARLGLLRPDPLRLKDRQMHFGCLPLDGRLQRSHAPSTEAIGLRDDQRDLVTCFAEPVQGRTGKRRRAGEDAQHGKEPGQPLAAAREDLLELGRAVVDDGLRHAQREALGNGCGPRREQADLLHGVLRGSTPVK